MSSPFYLYRDARCRERRSDAFPTAGWQSGYAAACKAAYAGSIPAPASTSRDRFSGRTALQYGDGLPVVRFRRAPVTRLKFRTKLRRVYSMEKQMSMLSKIFAALVVTSFVTLTGCATVEGWLGYSVALSGSAEVPPATTAASGTAKIDVKDDRSVSGTVTVADMKATAAHIHEAAAGKNGPVAVGLTKTSDTEFSVPAGAKLTEAQYAAYKAGNLYVNVHSAASPGGEVRGQLKP